MKFNCPSCRLPFLPENINIQTDLALCKDCGGIARISELVDEEFDTSTLSQPPKGAWYRQTMSETIIGATTRHPMAFMMVPFMCVWSGFSLGGIYGTQITNGKFSLMMSLFGLPFLIGTILLGSLALMAVCGKVEVRLRGRRGVVFVGVGSLGWKRALNLDEVDTIIEETHATNYPGSQGAGIVMKGKSRLRFATNLSEARRHFMLNALKAVKSRKV